MCTASIVESNVRLSKVPSLPFSGVAFVRFILLWFNIFDVDVPPWPPSVADVRVCAVPSGAFIALPR